MKHIARSLLCLFLSAVILTGCSSPKTNNEPTTASEPSSEAVLDTTQPADAQSSQGPVRTEQALEQIAQLGSSPDDNYRVWYEIFVYSFCDSNGDGIGDLQGVISKLDYLQELGVGGIWLMPVHPSSTYHKYNVEDYLVIDPAYGTMADFEELLTQCESRGIRVIMDLVINHTSSEHAWFREAVSYLKSLPEGQTPDPEACPYLDYYHFRLSEEAGSGYCAVTGTPYAYEALFNYDMPDLNLDNMAVREEFRSIMQFWLDKGVDGFRLDAAKEYYSGSTSRNVEMLSWIQQTATEIKPDCYLVAEVWDSFSAIAEYYTSGITSIFNYPFGDSDGKISKVLRGAGQESVVTTYAPALVKADAAYRNSNPDYIDAPFLSNHDVGRIAGFVSQDMAKTKLAGAMNLFMSGSVFVYYGEEIGMIGSGNDPSKRAPMYWNAARNDGTTNPPPDCTLPEEYPFGSLEEQKTDDESVYSYYRQAFAIRNAMPVISHGIVSVETALNTGCVSAQRKTWNEEACIILFNISPDGATVNLQDYDGWELAASLSADGEEIIKTGTTLTLPAYGTAILRPNV